ncbi:MAG TPA: ABC transporter substrate-binding protein [Beijerinckiaceae bacterium]|nr:ABC transporter substrate-binding protein [Beijerinckiaceae bacterium]
MRRRAVLGGLAAIAASSLAARAQHARSIPTVGYLFSFARGGGEHLWQACRLGLREAGYVEGVTIKVEPRWAEGDHGRLPELVRDLVDLRVDVIVAAATPASLAAKSGAGRTPIVIVAVADPVRIGLAASYSRPEGRVTGLSLLTPEVSAKRLQLLSTLLVDASRIATLGNPANPSHRVFFEETLAAAREAGIALVEHEAHDARRIEQAVRAAARAGVSAMLVFDDPVIWSHRKLVVSLAETLRMPTMYGYSDFVADGGLVSYGPHRPDLYGRTGHYVDRILKGADPGELPIERPIRFELALNLRTARALGLTIPPALLARADEVIE